MADEKNKPQLQQPELPGKLKAADKIEEGTIVKLKEIVWIKGTGKSKHLPKDSVHDVNPIAAEKLISKGAAVETTAPKPKAVAKKTVNKTDEEDD